MVKRIQNITRVQLKIREEEKFLLFGIVSAEPDYKLSLHINSKFRISLKNISPIRITDYIGTELIYSMFSDISGSPDIMFTLVSNRFGKIFLLKKLKNVDFILKVKYPEPEYNIEQVTAKLREIDSVSAVFNIDLNNFNDKKLQYLTQ
jgi:hypothetical protein